MSDLMGGGKCFEVRGAGWTGLACGVKGELTYHDREELEKFVRFMRSKAKHEKEIRLDLGGLE